VKTGRIIHYSGYIETTKMPKSINCGFPFISEHELVDHLVFDHDWQELSWIDRKRFETYSPEVTALVVEK